MTTKDNITTAEASEFGLAPGEWPTTLVRFCRLYTRTSAKRDAEGELVYVRYLAANGYTLLVWND